MNLQQRIHLMAELGGYMQSGDPSWVAAKNQAFLENPWFTPEFINLAVTCIAEEFLDEDKLRSWAEAYQIPAQTTDPRNFGIVMAGNIPLVGFHDFLSVFISGHRQTIKPSGKDQVLIRHLAGWLALRDPECSEYVHFSEMLKGCAGFIATGSNNSARYFEYYFAKYPHLIRKNRSSMAILSGDESRKDLDALADDVYTYFGLGCRNVSKLLVPEAYSFEILLDAFRKFDFLADHYKYKNNYDYQLTLLILNQGTYQTNGSIILTEQRALHSPIALLHYEYYKDLADVNILAEHTKELQCLVGQGHLPFGGSQRPSLADYADGADTLKFLLAN
jgi:hypothetical protein